MEDILWIEKYRPQLLKDIIGQDSEKIAQLIKNPMSMPNFLFVSKSAGTGKCLGKDTPVMMFDGSVKNVQDIKNGELVRGIDNTPRIVSGVTTGKSVMYKIHQKYGDDYIVNEDHILSLMQSGNKYNEKTINISVKDFLEKSKTFQETYKGYKTSVDFNEQLIDLDPYFLGLWLGDGSKKDQRISNPDIEVIKYLKEYAKKLGLMLHNHNGYTSNNHSCPYLSITAGNIGGGKNELLEMMRNNGLINNKHIPKKYMYNSRKNRLALLAGLLDADGNETCKCFEITQKNKQLANDIVYLSRSLGFRATINTKKGTIKERNFEGIYYRVFISGTVWEIPTKIKRKQIQEHKRQKNTLVCGVTIEKLPENKYYGFQVSEDGLFLLGDFTVTHNTSTALAIKREIGLSDTDFMSTNSSDERKIDFIRDTLKSFATAMRSDPKKPRIILMDEFDGMLSASQEMMKGFIEKYKSNVRFILTANNEEKIINPVKSRCTIIRFREPSKDDIHTRLASICSDETVFYEVDALNSLINQHYPDIRSMINVIQENASVGITLETLKKKTDLEDKYYNELKVNRNPVAARTLVIENNMDVAELLRRTIENTLLDYTTDINKIREIVYFAAEINYRMASGSDREIQMYAFSLKWLEIFK